MKTNLTQTPSLVSILIHLTSTLINHVLAIPVFDLIGQALPIFVNNEEETSWTVAVV